ncbi:hypothetical protein LQW54_006557 [Pestalotiopsis sp. IQ-011]
MCVSDPAVSQPIEIAVNRIAIAQDNQMRANIKDSRITQESNWVTGQQTPSQNLNMMDKIDEMDGERQRSYPRIKDTGPNIPIPSSGRNSAGEKSSDPVLMQAATRLTRECQRQGFNPGFTVSAITDGRYQGKVNINGIEVVDQRTWPNSGLAKQHIAAKALALDDHMHRVDSSHGSNRRSGDDDRADQGSEAPKVPMEIRLALACIRRMGGRGRDIPDDVMENPVAARGFVMGFEYASGLAEEDEEQRRRSLSPRVGERERAERKTKTPATPDLQPVAVRIVAVLLPTAVVLVLVIVVMVLLALAVIPVVLSAEESLRTTVPDNKAEV